MAPPEEWAREAVVGVRAHLGCGRMHVELPHGRLPLVGCYVGLDFSCVGVLPRCVGCLGFWHDSTYVRALICLVVGPSPLGSCRMFALLYFLYTLGTFSMLFRHVLLQMTNHQNLWKVLVLKSYF